MYELTLIVGRVGRDPELRMTPHGLPVTNFSVAVNHRYTDPQGAGSRNASSGIASPPGASRPKPALSMSRKASASWLKVKWMRRPGWTARRAAPGRRSNSLPPR